MIKQIILGTAFLAAASPVFAAQTTTYNWTGYYLGGQVGYSSTKDYIHDSSMVTGNSDYNDHFTLRGLTGGIFTGYNFQHDMWLFGVEADGELSGIDGDNSAWRFGTDMTAKITSQGSLRGRLGYVYDTSLFYITGGVAVGQIKTDYYDTGSRHDSNENTKTGWTLGGGFEHAFTPKWTVRFEYRYTDFGRITDSTITTDPGWLEHNDLTDHTVRVGIAYKF